MIHTIEIIQSGLIIFLLTLKLSEKNKRILIIYPMALLIYITLLTICDFTALQRMLFEIVLYFILPGIINRAISIKSQVFLSLTVIGIVTLLSSVTVLITSLITSNQQIQNITFLIVNSITLVFFIFISQSKRICDGFVELYAISSGVKIIILIFVWELVFLVSMQAAFLRYNFTKEINIFSSVLITLFVIASGVIFHLLITNNMKKLHYKRVSKMLETEMIKQTQYYEQLNLSYESIRKFRHDFNNIIIGLRSLLNQNDITASLKYLDQCTKHLNDSAPSIQTGHPIVNALLADKVQISKEKHININFNGYIAYDTMDPIDLCIVFGNVIDNAIEACRKLSTKQQKEICISAHIAKDMFFITCTNPSSEIMVDTNNILTTKDDPINHGIGLYNIRSIVQKYDGQMELSCANQVFKIELAFILPT